MNAGSVGVAVGGRIAGIVELSRAQLKNLARAPLYQEIPQWLACCLSAIEFEPSQQVRAIS